MADTTDSKSVALNRLEGSSPSIPTTVIEEGRLFRKIAESPWETLTMGTMVMVYHHKVGCDSTESLYWLGSEMVCFRCREKLPIYIQAVISLLGPYFRRP